MSAGMMDTGTGFASGRTECTMESGAIQGIYYDICLYLRDFFQLQNGNRQNLQTIIICLCIRSNRLSFCQNDGYRQAFLCSKSGNDKAIAAIISFSSHHCKTRGFRPLSANFPISCSSGILHHLKIGKTAFICISFNLFHLCNGYNAHIFLLDFIGYIRNIWVEAVFTRQV